MTAGQGRSLDLNNLYILIMLFLGEQVEVDTLKEQVMWRI